MLDNSPYLPHWDPGLQVSKQIDYEEIKDDTVEEAPCKVILYEHPDFTGWQAEVRIHPPAPGRVSAAPLAAPALPLQ